ncbi:hypothetical protein JGS22_012275 [Streptomyces sp. P38-E01]|uniref:Alpha/beta hydrolase n=1 Tax=Streptomyces tardus TaxID=2780544 RepID=A0A949N8B7_9ACTN|nr:hypothetical protein [Streptomyces tardus]
MSSRRRRTAWAAVLTGTVAASLLAAPSFSSATPAAPSGVSSDSAPGGSSGGSSTGGSSAEAADCPDGLKAAATCYAGRDHNGAYYTVAIPDEWNRSLVVHAHGGPGLGDGSDPERSVGDLERWSVMVEEGYAWVGSSYRRGGYGTRMAAADTENVRRAFVAQFGEPRRTYLHGQSWGGNVAAKILETYGSSRSADAAPGTRGVRSGPYDGALMTNGLLAGGSRGYDFRVDLRAVYQFYCQNLPRPSEPQYPVWQGLPADSDLTTGEVNARLQECTGHSSPPAERTAEQQRKLTDILAVTGVPEHELASHLRFSVFTFRDVVHNRLDGRNPFSNKGVRYSGSRDDAALNAGVERFSADRSAARDLAWDSDLTGRVDVPVLTLHAIDDPTVYVENESAYRATLRAAHRGHRLVQSFTRESEHSGLSTAEYANSVAALDSWVREGRRPTPRSLAASCARFDEEYGTGCFHDPTYRPAPYSSRVNARPGGHRWPAMTSAQERRWSKIEGIGIAP